MDEQVVDTVEADEGWKQRIAEAWHETAAQHMHLEDGFSLVVVYDDEPIGLISVDWRQLPPPLSETHEGYIDIIRTLFLPLEGLDHWTKRNPLRQPPVGQRMCALDHPCPWSYNPPQALD